MAAIKGAGNITVTFNSNNITAYLNQVDLEFVVNELESTHLASTGMTAEPGLASYTVGFQGDWHATLDGYIGVDALAGTKRTVVIAITDSDSNTVSYTWTSQGWITGYTINTAATGKIGHDTQLRLNGAPTRATS